MTTTTITTPAAHNLTDAAKMTSLCRRSLERHIKAGTGPKTFHVGRSVRIRHTDLMQWMADLANRAASN